MPKAQRIHPAAIAAKLGYFMDKDATGQHYVKHIVRLSEDGTWEMPHPTDPKGGWIAAPTDVEIKAE